MGVSTISQAAYIALHQDDEEEDQEIRKNNVYVFLFTTYGSTGCSTNEEFPDARAFFYTAGEREFYHLARFAHWPKNHRVLDERRTSIETAYSLYSDYFWHDAERDMIFC